jgi:hypothetical protein
MDSVAISETCPVFRLPWVGTSGCCENPSRSRARSCRETMSLSQQTGTARLKGRERNSCRFPREFDSICTRCVLENGSGENSDRQPLRDYCDASPIGKSGLEVLKVDESVRKRRGPRNSLVHSFGFVRKRHLLPRLRATARRLQSFI